VIPAWSRAAVRRNSTNTLLTLPAAPKGVAGFLLFAKLRSMTVAPITIKTLGDLRRHGGRLFASCTAQFSGHGAFLDTDKLIARFGEDYVFVGDTRIAAACVCKQCGHRGATITLHPNTKVTGTNPYLKAKGG